MSSSLPPGLPPLPLSGDDHPDATPLIACTCAVLLVLGIMRFTTSFPCNQKDDKDVPHCTKGGSSTTALVSVASPEASQASQGDAESAPIVTSAAASIGDYASSTAERMEGFLQAQEYSKLVEYLSLHLTAARRLKESLQESALRAVVRREGGEPDDVVLKIIALCPPSGPGASEQLNMTPSLADKLNTARARLQAAQDAEADSWHELQKREANKDAALHDLRRLQEEEEQRRGPRVQQARSMTRRRSTRRQRTRRWCNRRRRTSRR